MSEPMEVDPLRFKFHLLFPHLDERQRRLYLGAEARALGRGGTETVARAAGVSRRLVRVGREEVEMAPDPQHRVRRPGGGRKRVTETDLTLVADLESLIHPVGPGDRSAPLRWTCRSSPNLAAALGEMGHRISASGVQRLLRGLGYRLQGRVPAREGRAHPDPDGQFRHISELVSEHMRDAEPVLGVDARKGPLMVDREDLSDPNGPTELEEDSATWSSTGEDDDTAGFAVEAVRHWWHAEGRLLYRGAGRLLVCADTGGRARCHPPAWRDGLRGLAAETGLAITVCHLPVGVRRWTRKEERLLAQVSTKWRGHAPATHQVTVDVIGLGSPRADGTRTQNGPIATLLIAESRVDEGVSGEAVMRPDAFHGEWNYTVVPPARA
jgi:hypothetical protein